MKIKLIGLIFLIFVLSSFGFTIHKENKADQIIRKDKMALSVAVNQYASMQQDTTKADPKPNSGRRSRHRAG